MLSNKNNSESGFNDSQNENDYSLLSLSEQIGLLEERLADCNISYFKKFSNLMIMD